MIDVSGLGALAAGAAVAATVVVATTRAHVGLPMGAEAQSPALGEAGPQPGATSAAAGAAAAPAAGVRDDATPGDGRRVAIVYNPTKFNEFEPVKAQLESVAAERGWPPPEFIETTQDDPGTGQAAQAVKAGATLVCALGGDGTVRAVAAALVDGEVPLGLLPGGTGNLLARNLEVPIDDMGEAFRVALDGADRRVDVGVLNVIAPEETQDQPKDYFFLVMAGVGFDADVMADAPEKLKEHMGWAAYLVSGVKNLDGERFEATLRYGDGEREHRHIRSVLIGNCGKLQGGVELIPDAEPDDGLLDTVVLSPEGIVGWAGVGASIVTGHHAGHDKVEMHRTTSVLIEVDEGGQAVQLDGDPIGLGHKLTATVKPKALVVRVVPEKAPDDAMEPAPEVPQKDGHNVTHERPEDLR